MGGVIGGAVGAVVVVLLAAGGLYVYLKKRRKSEASGSSTADLGGVTLTIEPARGEAMSSASSSDGADKKAALPTPVPGVPTQPATRYGAGAQSSTPAPEMSHAGAPLNDPGRWKYFVSHVQRECAVEAVMLSSEFGKEQCWVDRFMQDKSVAAMKEGVVGSETFVCILSDGYFASEYCCNEMRWAFKNKKPIVSTYKNGVNVGALLNKAPDDFRDRIKAIDSIALNASDPDYFQVGIAKIAKRLPSASLGDSP